jgi:hypothetical protein
VTEPAKTGEPAKTERDARSRSRPPDPAGTRPKVDPESLVPAELESPLPAADAHVIDSTAEEELLEAAATNGAGDLLPERRAAAGVGPVLSAPETPHAPRFQFLLGALIALGVAAIAATAAVVIGHKSPPPPAFWSSWRPVASGASPEQQIADHVGAEYRFPSGKQLDAVTGGPLEVAGLPMTVVLRSDPSNGGNISFVSGKGVLYRLCGLGSNCALDQGKPTVARHLLLQREALELALYTFRYVDGVNQVVVFMPPRPGSRPSQALFFRPNDLAAALRRPLRDTLTAQTPNPANFTRSADAPLVDRLTTPDLYSFTLTQANQDTSVFLVLSPFGVTTSTGQAGAGTTGATGP